jgi:hypothetical protein
MRCHEQANLGRAKGREKGLTASARVRCKQKPIRRVVWGRDAL